VGYEIPNLTGLSKKSCTVSQAVIKLSFKHDNANSVVKFFMQNNGYHPLKGCYPCWNSSYTVFESNRSNKSGCITECWSSGFAWLASRACTPEYQSIDIVNPQYCIIQPAQNVWILAWCSTQRHNQNIATRYIPSRACKLL